jgi:pimeloyl-ACP methyl ester carboxylesterase
MKKNVTRNGCQLAYVEAGTGEAVVLLHGLCGSSAYWEKLIPMLSTHYRVIAPDLRGHGESSSPDRGPYAMEQFADDLAALLDSLGIAKIALFGHSLGGYVTLAFAEKYPDRLHAFSLVHSTAFPDSEEAKEGRSKAAESIRAHGMKPYMATLAPKLFAPAHLATLVQEVAQVRSIGENTSPLGAIHTLLGMRERPDRNHVLREAAVPVLLVAGEYDQVFAPEKTFSVKAAHITEVLLKDAGHISMLETPEKLYEAMRAFLQQHFQ